MPSVLVPLAHGFEDLEAVTIVDLLRRAGIAVVTAGLEPGLVLGSRGTRIQPDATLDDALAQDYDLVALPGGLPGADHLRDDARIQARLKKMAAAGKHTAAICAAPMALAAAGLLDGRRATAYPGVLDGLALPTTTKRAVSGDDSIRLDVCGTGVGVGGASGVVGAAASVACNGDGLPLK